jgi:hypothetical protein
LDREIQRRKGKYYCDKLHNFTDIHVADAAQPKDAISARVDDFSGDIAMADGSQSDDQQSVLAPNGAEDLPSPWPSPPTAESNSPPLELSVTTSMDDVCKMTEKAEEAKGAFMQALQREADAHKRLLKTMSAVVEAAEMYVNNADRFV